MNLSYAIEDLISSNSSDFDIAKHIKENINNYRLSLDAIFEKHQGKSFLVKHSKEIDRYIKIIFKYALRKHFGEFLPIIDTLPLTITSLGSHAREQLCVYSDIDIMIVYKSTDGYNLKPIIETILQVAWDCGLKISHRVHEIDDLYPASREDHTIKSSFIESTYLCGSKYLWINIQAQIQNIKRDRQKDFISSKIKERKLRLDKYPSQMQPDIKSSLGGLRDLNTLYWIANTLFSITKIKDLSPKIITDMDYTKLMKAVDFLFRVRIALHLSVNKKQDRLLFQYIPDVCKKLNLTETKLMQKTFESMLSIETICEYTIRKIIPKVMFDKKNIKKLKDSRVSKNIFIKDDIVCSPIHTQKININYFIEQFIKQSDKDLYYDITYVHYLQSAISKTIDPKLMKSLFYKNHLFGFFMALYKGEQLNIIFPSFKKVQHLPQFDRYHKHPVDIHSIKTLKALQRIKDINIFEVFDLLREEEKALLRVVCFLHDCGKGRRKDHSILGAIIVEKNIKVLGFCKEHQEFAYILVRYHTLMSNISNRQDIYSEKVIYSFISKLKNITVLNLLYVLTYADIESVNEGAYSSFNAKLLNELFLLSHEAFENKNLITEAQKRTKKEANLKKDLNFIALKASLKKQILSIESNLLFFKYKPKYIVEISVWTNSLASNYDFKITNKKTLCIEIIRKKSLNLGYLLARLNNFNIATMDIFKFFKNTKYFRVEFLESVQEHDILFIKDIINQSFNMNKKIKHNKLEIKKSEIEINCDHSKTYATMSVNTKDQPALLSNIMSVFDDIGIDIASAKIQTIKQRARNLFLIEKNGKFCINQDKIVKKLTKGI